ncbi:MAG: VOC family protein [Acidobacteria bacterium]|nr:VOC family protein [Acidobacteriota bacterium]
MVRMKTLLLHLSAALCCFAQLPAPNPSGVANGHIHLNISDPAAHRKFWVDGLGATPAKLGRMDTMKFPDVILLLTQAESSGGSEGSAVGHIGFRVRNLREYMARWKAAGIAVNGTPAPDARQVFLTAPDGLLVEVGEDSSLSVPIAYHHTHFFGQPPAAQAWYVKMFGAIPGKRGKFDAADLPGANLTFSQAEGAVAPTKGRALDHIGFEIRDLEAFCKKLEASGVKFDMPYRKIPALGLSIAFLTDPWGTYIELTEGLNRL